MNTVKYVVVLPEADSGKRRFMVSARLSIEGDEVRQNLRIAGKRRKIVNAYGTGLIGVLQVIEIKIPPEIGGNDFSASVWQSDPMITLHGDTPQKGIRQERSGSYRSPFVNFLTINS